MSELFFQPQNPYAHKPADYTNVGNDMLNFFSALNNPEAMSPYAGQPMTVTTVLDTYRDLQKIVSAGVLMRMHSYSGWWARALPLTFANGIEARKWKTSIFKPTIMPRRAPFGTTKFIQHTELSGSWEFEGHTLGATFEYDQLRGPGGQEYLLNKIDCIDSSVALTCKVLCTGAILTAHLPQLTDEQMLGQPYNEVSQLMERYSDMFAILHKKEKGIYGLVDYIIGQRRRSSIRKPDFMVLPDGAISQIKFGGDFETEVYRRGESAVANLETDRVPRLRDMDVYEMEKIAPDAVDRIERLYDPLTTHCQLGHYYISECKIDECAAEDACVAKERGFAYLNLTGNVFWQEQKFDELLRSDAHFDSKSGRLLRGDLADFANNYQKVFKTMGLKAIGSKYGNEDLIDPFISFNQNGKPVVCEVFGMMNKDFLPEMFIKKYATQAAKVIRRIMGEAAMESIDRLIQIMEDQRNVVLETAAGLTEAGKWIGLNITENLIPGGAAAVNSYGVDPITLLPEAGSLIGEGFDISNYPLPPGYSSYAHMKYLASEYAGIGTAWIAGNADRREIWRRVVEGVAAMEKFVKLVQSVWSAAGAENLVMTEAACPVFLRAAQNTPYADRVNASTATVMNGFFDVLPPLSISIVREENGRVERGNVERRPVDQILSEEDIGNLIGVALATEENVESIRNILTNANVSAELANDLSSKSFKLRDNFAKKVETDANKSGLGSLENNETWLGKLLETPSTPGGNDSLFERLRSGNQGTVDAAVRELNGIYSVVMRLNGPFTQSTLGDIRSRSQRKPTYMSRDQGISASNLEEVRSRSRTSRAGDYREQVASFVENGPGNSVVTHLIVNPRSVNDVIFHVSGRDVATSSVSRGFPTEGREGEREVGGSIFEQPHLIGAVSMRATGGDHFNRGAEPIQTYVDTATGRPIPLNEARGNLPSHLIELAGNSDWFLEHMREAIDDDLQSPLERALRIFLLCTRCDVNVFENMVSRNFDVPLAYGAFDPFIHFTMAGALLLNDRIGLLEHDFADTQMINDGEIKSVDIHVTAQFGAGVVNVNEVSCQEAVMFRQYIDGGSGQVVETFASDSINDGSRGGVDFDPANPRERMGDRFVVSMGPTTSRSLFPHTIDVSGGTHANSVRGIGLLTDTARRVGEQLRTPGTAFLSYRAGLFHLRPPTCQTVETFSGLRDYRENIMNTLCCAGAQRDYNRMSGCYTKQVCNGAGPLGRLREDIGTIINGGIGLIDNTAMTIGTTVV